MKTTKLLSGFWLLLTFMNFVQLSCSSKTNKVTHRMEQKIKTNSPKKFILTAPIVQKEFKNKIGKHTKQKEYYLQASIQDYYIKFCESSISHKDLENHLSSLTGLIKAVTLEIEYRDGFWDICNEKMEQQSRSGKYVIIHRIINQ